MAKYNVYGKCNVCSKETYIDEENIECEVIDGCFVNMIFRHCPNCIIDESDKLKYIIPSEPVRKEFNKLKTRRKRPGRHIKNLEEDKYE